MYFYSYFLFFLKIKTKKRLNQAYLNPKLFFPLLYDVLRAWVSLNLLFPVAELIKYVYGWSEIDL